MTDNKIVQISSSTTTSTKKKQKVLEEDDYTEALEKIIERDFFPYLKESSEEEPSTDVASIGVDFTPVINQNSVIEATPSTFETPTFRPGKPDATPDPSLADPNDTNDKRNSQVIKDCTKMSLNGFLSKYTSEDNASFEVIQEMTKQKHKEKYPWLYRDEEVEKAKLDSMLEYKDSSSKNNLTWTYTNKNHLMYVPEGVELTAEEKIKSMAKQQQTVYKNTRLEINPFRECTNKIGEIASLQARRQEGKVGVDGKELGPVQKSPQVNGYGFVPSTPILSPGASPLMTWGEVASTPAPLDREPMTPGPQFRMPEVPPREKLAHSLADSLSARKKQHVSIKEKTLENMKSRLTSPRTPSLEALSPAAQKLATTRLGIKRGRDTALAASYSPSPSPIRTPSLTDGLLKLPQNPAKRQKAADFF